MWWVGQRASDAILVGPGLEGFIGCEGSVPAGPEIGLSLDRSSNQRDPWDSSRLGELSSRLLASAAGLSSRAERGRDVIPYRPIREARDAFPAATLHSNSVDLFEALDDNLAVAPELAREGLSLHRSVRVVPESPFGDLKRGLGSPLVVKAPTSCAGGGCRLVADHAALELARSQLGEPLLGVEFLTGPSFNFHGLLAADSTTILFPPSMQLVGHPSLTDNRLGYCGNAFLGTPVGLEARLMDLVTQLGAWLGRRGYRGIFGGDAIRTEAGWSLIDLNPRFQASTLLLSMGTGTGEIAGAHCEAIAGRPIRSMMSPDAGSAFELRSDEMLVQTVHRLTGGRAAVACRASNDGVYSRGEHGPLSFKAPEVRLPGEGEAVLLDGPPEGTRIAPGATLCRCWTRVRGLSGTRMDSWIKHLHEQVTSTLQLRVIAAGTETSA